MISGGTSTLRVPYFGLKGSYQALNPVQYVSFGYDSSGTCVPPTDGRVHAEDWSCLRAHQISMLLYLGHFSHGIPDSSSIRGRTLPVAALRAVAKAYQDRTHLVVSICC